MASVPVSAMLREQSRAAVVWLAGPAGRRVVAAWLLGLAGLAVFTLYEAAALGLPVAREEPARFDLYHAGRTAFALFAAALAVAALVRARARPSPLDIENCSVPSLTVAVWHWPPRPARPCCSSPIPPPSTRRRRRTGRWNGRRPDCCLPPAACSPSTPRAASAPLRVDHGRHCLPAAAFPLCCW